MHLGWIRSFVAVVDRSGFVNAGLHLRRAQSRVSADVRSLETEVGAVLLDRASRPVAVTSAGNAFLPFARQILDCYDRARKVIAASAQTGHGVVRLGTMPSVASLVLPDLLTRFARRHPGISVDAREEPPVNLPDQLLSGEVELIIVPRGYVDVEPGLEWTPLWTERLLVLVPHDHRLGNQENTSVQELEGEVVITPGGGRTLSGNTPEFQALLDREGVSTKANGLVIAPITLASMVRLGMCVAVMSELGVQLAGQVGVRALPLRDEGAKRVVVLARRRDSALSTAARELESFIVESPLSRKLPLMPP